jgi:hypothetical protein
MGLQLMLSPIENLHAQLVQNGDQVLHITSLSNGLFAYTSREWFPKTQAAQKY